MVMIWAKAFPILEHICHAPDITAKGTIFNVLSYDAVGPRFESIAHPTICGWMRYVLCRSRELKI